MADPASFDNTMQIDAYLRHEMTAAQQEAFEARLQAEPGLREELEFQRSVMESLALHAEDQALKHRIDGIRQGMQQRKPGEPQWRNMLLIAVFLLLSALVAGRYWSCNKTGSANDPLPGTPLPDTRPDTDTASSAPPLPPAPTQPVATTTPRPTTTEPADGSSAPKQFSRQLSMRYLKVAQGQLEDAREGKTLALTVFQTNEVTMLSYWADPVLQLFIPRQFYDPSAEYRLIELDQEGHRVLYLGVGPDVYSIQAGNDSPRKVEPESVPKWLKR